MTHHTPPSQHNPPAALQTGLADVRSSLSQATDLPAVLATAFDAFEAIRHLARHVQNQDPDLLAAFMTAASAAVDGRDAITDAPSLPPAEHPAPARQRPEPNPDANQAADAIAALAAGLAARLDVAASLPSALPDRAACQDAAEAARQIHALMARPTP